MGLRRTGRRLAWDCLEPRACPSGLPVTEIPVPRTDAFFVQTAALFKQQAAEWTPYLVFYGDSITYNMGYGDGGPLWQQRLAPLNAADFGLSGDSTQNLLWRIEDGGEFVGHPDVVVVPIGIATLVFGCDSPRTPSAGSRRSWRRSTASRRRRRSWWRSCIPYGEPTSPIRPQIAEVNADLATLADEQTTYYINPGPMLEAPDGTITANFEPGLIHPNALGYQVILDGMMGLLDELLGVFPEPTTPPPGVDVTTTAVVPSTSSSAFGQEVSFTATVSDAPGDDTPAGTVQFYVDNTPAGDPVSLDSSGVATYTPSPLSAGSHSVTAAFIPASIDFTASRAAAVSVAVSHTTLTGTVFLDVDGDGQREADEPGLAGRTVYLDVMGTGAYNPSDPTAVTAADGSFTLTDFPAGDSTLRVVTYAPDVAVGASRPQALVAGQSASGQDFGLRLTSPVAPLPVVAAAFGPGTDADVDTAVIKGLYNLILGRPADPTSLASGVAALRQGETAAQLAAYLDSTPEYDARVIRSYYQTFLGHSADPSGLAGWVKVMQGGWTEAQVAESFLITGSQDETDAAYVQSLYEDVLGRQATPAEVTTWTGAGLSRLAEAVDFVLSSGANSRAIDDDYVAIMGRPAVAADADSWLPFLQGDGWTLDEVKETFLGSPGFAARAAETM